MMLNLLRRDKKKHRTIARIPDGRRVYAVGDIHGMKDAMDRLLDAIAADLEGYDGQSTVIFLGDYVDRGPDSKGVIERLASGDLPGDRQIFLFGNHEQAMLEVLDDEGERRSNWLGFGGAETLQSYGIGRTQIVTSGRPISSLMAEAIPPAHVDFLRRLDHHHRVGDYLFVHAGIRPGVPIEEQSVRDMLWIRDSFIASEDDHGVIVVHGHTISEEPEDLPNRIGVDTGCFASGKLTAVCLEGEGRRFVAV